MTMRKLFKRKVNKLTLSFVITITVITLLLSFAASSLYYVNTYNMVNNAVAESIENNQNNLVKNFSALERDLNQTTYQLLNSVPIYNIVSGLSNLNNSQLDSAIKNLNNFLSSYVGLRTIFIINLTDNKIYNKVFGNTTHENLATHIPYENLLENYDNGQRIFSSYSNDAHIIFTSHDFRGFLTLYMFEKTSLLDNFRDIDYNQYNTAVYYKNKLIFSIKDTDLPECYNQKLSEQKHIFTYTKDNYTAVTDIMPHSLKTFYHTFVKQMIAFTAFILLLGIIAIIISEKFFDKKTEAYTNSLLSRSHQHHYTAIKSTIQQAIRNQYISPNEQSFLDDYFQKIEFKEFYSLMVQLDNVNSLLLSSSYKEITILMKKIMLIFENKLSKLGTCIIIDIDFDTIGIVVAAKQVLQDNEIINHIELAKNDIAKTLSLTVTTAIAETFETSSDIPYSFIQLRELIKYRFFTGYNSIILENIESDTEVIYPAQLQNQITALFVAHKTDELTTLLQSFFNEARKTDCNEAKKWVINLTLELTKRSASTNNSTDIISELSLSDTLDNQFEILMKYFVNANIPHDENKISNDTFIQKTNAIIEKEFSNLDFNLSLYAQLLDISGIYAGQKFKKTFNKNFNTYLAEYRIQKAAEFLHNQDYKISEIATMCGFSSSGYFVKTFKKITSMTPTEYRNNLTNK